DGYCRDTMLVNGTFPGPPIRGNWGDWFEITVINKLENCNGTAIHWHGVRQLHTVWEDGVPGVTQCPIAPGQSKTYLWRATQYGTSWYHSHFSLQYPDGVAGPIIIDGPTSKNYNIDKGPLILTDWYHDDAFSLYYQEVMATPSPSFLGGTPSVLINGQGNFTQVVNNGTKLTTNIDPSQHNDNVTVYKYRIINMSTLTQFSFWIDGHDFWVVATDFVPIAPIKRQFLNVANGQRYDILIEAKTKANLEERWHNHPNFWIKMRHYTPSGELRPIVVRDLTGEIPTSMAFTNPFEVDRRPGIQNPKEVFAGDHGDRKTESSEQNQPYLWDFGSSHTDLQHPNGSYVSFMIDWGNATLGLAADGISPDMWNPRFVPIVLDTVDKWTVFAIAANWTAEPNNGVPLGRPIPTMAHPIHLHGHDFVILAQSSNPFIYGHNYELDLVNPARRDVVMLPASGFVIIAFKTDNPGTWLMHCHIAWHSSAGLVLQWVERPSEIPGLMDNNPGVKAEFKERCHQWEEHENSGCQWQKGFVALQDDSGV
ncbi:multicopper oxidase-domain-containing protein, partial [Terfezia claveryi]